MYPAQTSLIPIQIALARFWESLDNLGINPFTFNQNYPYWYLGTTPYRYLTGPILPMVLVGLHRILPSFTLFEIFFGLIVICWVIGALGVYALVRELGGIVRNSRKDQGVAVLAAFFWLFGPMVPFFFRFSNGLYLIAFSFLPFVLLAYLKLLRRWSLKLAILMVGLLTLVILLDSLIIPSIILGMAVIFLAQAGWKKVEEKLKSTLVLLFFAFLLATAWYSPGYWLTLLGAPSLAGKGLLVVVGQLVKLLPTALALVVAAVSVRFFKKKNLLRDFCFYWLFAYVFLTLLRFLSDPDFWLDWSSYAVELQLGVAVLGSLVVGRVVKHANNVRMKIIRINPNILIFSVFCFLYSVFWLFITNKYVIGTLQWEIEKTVEYRIGKVLSRTAKPGEKVFLSGTTAFWLNSFFDIAQVRGGVDQAAVHPTWREAVWEIREGPSTSSGQESSQKALEWLRKLEVDYLVVHTFKSLEFYHDFADPEKFEDVEELEKVYDEGGDRLYEVN